MSKIRLQSIKIKNYRSFGLEQEFNFPSEEYAKPTAIVGYNNSGKTNLLNALWLKCSLHKSQNSNVKFLGSLVSF